MTFHVSTHGDVVVVETPRGPITDWRKIEELNATLRAQIDAGRKKILLDLANTTFMTSLTIGVLVGIQVNAFKNGADFVLAGMFDFEIAEDAQHASEAIASSTERERAWVA